MTPKEKAEELVDKFYPMFLNSVRDTLAKQCALIAVDEIFGQWKYYGHMPEEGLFWQEVKAEIENL